MMGFGYGMMGGWGPGYGYGYGSNFASGYGGGYWWTGLIGLGIQLLSWILIIAVGIALFRWIGKRIPASSNPYTTDAMRILSERYARGEINKNEYISLKKDILN